MNIDRLIRQNIHTLKPYSSARLEDGGATGILLDANENSLGSVIDGQHNRYPDPLQTKLKDKISSIKKVSSDSIFIGNGSDEAIDLLIRAVCEPGLERILICPPTYGVYQVCAAINHVQVSEVPLTKQFELDHKSVLNRIDNSIKLIFLCSPNNPTGNILSKESVKLILERYKGLLVIDEAYIDFSTDPGWMGSLRSFPNLVILQTLSKAWGMANIRLGMAFGHHEIINVLNRIKYPYNVSGVTQQLAIDALDHLDKKNLMVAELRKQKQYLLQKIESLKIVVTVFRSEANFLLVKFKRSYPVFEHLKKNGVVVRDRSSAHHCEQCLRITIGTVQQNQTLLKLLKQIEDHDE